MRPVGRSWLMVGSAIAGTAVVSGWLVLGRPGRGAPTAAAATAGVWPEPGAPLSPPPLVAPAGARRLRVYLDAGHGVKANVGNLSAYCVEERAFTLLAAIELGDRLAETGRFEVALSRDAGEEVDYQARIDDATALGADVFLSLHSDVRGSSERWAPEPGLSCAKSLAAPGFSVLFADGGDDALDARRARLARALAEQMIRTGFPPYDGAHYQGDYARDALQPGAFVDRHAPDQRIFVLRRAPMPSVIVETHHALDPREADRWSEDRTFDAFAAAVGAALLDAAFADDRGAGR
jgi:N-acetylmuramoyl-L-alanine amidase